jgi:hypothetical protein
MTTQYIVPTPEGEQPDLELAYLVVDGGQLIPISDITKPVSLSIVTVGQDEEEEASA